MLCEVEESEDYRIWHSKLYLRDLTTVPPMYPIPGDSVDFTEAQDAPASSTRSLPLTRAEILPQVEASVSRVAWSMQLSKRANAVFLAMFGMPAHSVDFTEASGVPRTLAVNALDGSISVHQWCSLTQTTHTRRQGPLSPMGSDVDFTEVLQPVEVLDFVAQSHPYLSDFHDEDQASYDPMTSKILIDSTLFNSSQTDDGPSDETDDEDSEYEYGQ